MTAHVITFQTPETWADGIALFVERGLTFKADFHSLTVTLTGGY